MVSVPSPQGGNYCIDSTEVTQSQYKEFLGDSGIANLTKPPGCTAKTGYQPNTSVSGCANAYDPDAKPSHPVVCVDWCDAWAFCDWAGKRLCGKVGGGPADYNLPGSETVSQWFNVCSKGGTQAFPYGPTYSASTCNGSDASVGATFPASQFPSCEGGYMGVLQMSGNASEWEDSCDGTTSSSKCRRRGGSYSAPAAELNCSVQKGDMRNSAWPQTGFRCCSG